MQHIESSWGRKSINVEDRCPTRAIRHHLGNVHVGTPVEDVVLEVKAEIAKMVLTHPDEAHLWTPKMVRDTLRFARWQHEENRAEYAVVMGASL